MTEAIRDALVRNRTILAMQAVSCETTITSQGNVLVLVTESVVAVVENQ